MTDNNGHLTEEKQVLIVGAGPTGLTMALELHRHGIPCRLIDKRGAPSEHSKALAVHARTLEIFEDMGVVGDILERGQKLTDVEFFLDGKSLVNLTFDNLDTRYPFVISLAQSETEQVLIDHLNARGVSIQREVELVSLSQNSTEVSARLKHADGSEEEVITPWLIAADGAHSTVRHALSLTFKGNQYPELFLLADAQIEGDLAQDAIHLFNCDDGLLAIFPFGDNRFRVVADKPLDTTHKLDSEDSEKEIAPTEQAESAPTLAEIQEIVDHRTTSRLRLKDSSWLASFTIHRRQVEDYQHGRIFLAGDAAHIHSPAGGQGMNTGIQDAYNLAWKLALVMNGVGRPVLLNSFTVERRAVARKVLKMTDFMTRLNTMRNPLAKAMRNRMAPVLAGQEMLRRRMPLELSQLAINYRKSPIVAEHRINLVRAGVASRLKKELPEIGEWLTFDTGPAPGDRAPDERVIDVRTGEPVRFFDVLAGIDHHLILFAGERSSASGARLLADIANFVMDQYGRWIKVHLVSANARVWGDFPVSGTRLLDPEFLLHHKYGAACDCVYLVRPDGYVGFRSLPADHEALADYIDKILVTPAH